MGTLEAGGFEITDNPVDADILVVNTCAFIEAAREESIEEILNAAEFKQNERAPALVVAGCLPVRFMEELKAELPEVDLFMGLVTPGEMLEACTTIAEGRGAVQAGGPASRPDEFLIPRSRKITTPGHYAYLKIAEGCSNPCTFCAIPLMRGSTRSAEPDTLLDEAGMLSETGVRELILVAQDTTHYGSDLSHSSDGVRPDLAGLIRRLDREVERLEWIRLMYTYPSRITDDLLSAMADTSRVVPYLDIPIQNGSESILKAMGRGMGPGALSELLDRIRERVPGIAMRTSIIVGFPGETERDFLDTVDLVKKVRFERLGVFTYSGEEGTPAFEMEGQLPVEEMERRSRELLQVQQEIVLELNNSLRGTIVDVMIDEELADLKPFSLLGRTPWDAPEVDQGIYLELSPDTPVPRPGEIVRAEVVGSTDYDLEGVVTKDSA
jgi:ribosomal protein S12 methylthiotransferase